MKKLLLIATILLSTGFSLFSPKIKEMPLLIGTAFDSKNFDLSKQRGKIVIINFWASWSLECEKEMIFLNNIHKKYNSKNLQIIGISIDEDFNREKAFRASYSLNYPNIFVSDINKSDFDQPQNLPTSYLIDQKGRIFKIYDDRNNLEKNLEEDIKKLIDKENQELNKNHAVQKL